MQSQERLRRRPIKIVAFVDWNSQVFAAKRSRSEEPTVQRILEHVLRSIKNSLANFISDFRFEVPRLSMKSVPSVVELLPLI